MNQDSGQPSQIEAPASVGYDPSDFDQDSFLKDLRSGDALAVVLRGQLYVESRLALLVAGMLPYPDRLGSRQIRFPQLATMANALGVLLPGQSAPLAALNRLRAPIRMTHSSRTAKSQQIRMQARERNA